ncbi:hypothetical protein ACE6H2_011382 [Prunus campanulata]
MCFYFVSVQIHAKSNSYHHCCIPIGTSFEDTIFSIYFFSVVYFPSTIIQVLTTFFFIFT